MGTTPRNRLGFIGWSDRRGVSLLIVTTGILSSVKWERAWKGGGRLARRARSFKQELVGRINQLRSPGNLRHQPPALGHNSSKDGSGHHLGDGAYAGDSGHLHRLTDSSIEEQPHYDAAQKEAASISRDLRDVQNACGYFKDCVAKGILDMVPGSASVVLETVIHLLTLLKKKNFASDDSSVLQSRTNRVHGCLSELLEWADNVMLRREEASLLAAQKIILSLQGALSALVEYYGTKDCNNGRASGAGAVGTARKLTSRPATANGLCHSKSECANISVNSLPDIPLTPREREILSSTPGAGPHGMSSSTDDILTPPPKPPLPFASLDSIDSTVPPLPPKKRSTSKAFLEAPSFSSSFNDWLSPLSSPLSQSRASSVDCIDRSEDDLWSSLPNSFGEMGSHNPNLSFTFSSVQTTMVKKSSTTTKMCRSDSIEHLISQELNESGASFSTVTTLQNGQTQTKNSLTTYNRTDQLEDIPPALPAKQRRTPGESPAAVGGRLPRVPSQYDNVLPPLTNEVADEITRKLERVQLRNNPRQTSSMSQPLSEVPPPLPPKRRTIQAYMQTFGPIPVPSEGTLNVVIPAGKQMMSRVERMEIFWDGSLAGQRPKEEQFEQGSPPALPPKRRLDKENPSGTSTPLPSVICTSTNSLSPLSSSTAGLIIEETASIPNTTATPLDSHVNDSENCGSVSGVPVVVEVECPHKEEDSGVVDNSAPNSKENTPPSSLATTLQESSLLGSTVSGPVASGGSGSGVSGPVSVDIMECIEVEPFLVFSDSKDDVLRGLKGGPPDALLVYATKTTDDKGRDFVVQETFLTTYRSFIPAQTLVEKLISRYDCLIQFSSDPVRLKYARNSFSLLVRVVDDLCLSDATDELLIALTHFTHTLLLRGDLSLARALRQKVVEKHSARQRAQECVLYANLKGVVLSRGNTLLSFKSEALAQQMTLLDNELFQKIDIPEVLIWAKQQNEERSPNLTRFTEHFNNMSYWARSCVLQQTDQRERERCVIKFLKMMKALRRLNNFNSYLALLSALDSAPLRRLDWQRAIVEGLREFSVLIDSSSSFRAYRQAVAETQPPCIPYIGLILQDLTFVHVGNTDYIESNGTQIINFFKCWQQYNILEPMRKFKKKPYNIRRNDEIIDFFNNFEDYLSEEAMWQISETIKPRGKK
ncbi:rap guanine nucleotide exchange factor 1-like isoform X2 [Varroa destructor]|uniref:CRK SH3-binding GNRP n=1 Tax=Varroa destructor TaxID=109461 RepID=A0A7M7KYJ7_VARDE|nr:rap guanine nucleotide exchange factor 1-like isoform X2 [Varroa destructor]